MRSSIGILLVAGLAASAGAQIRTEMDMQSFTDAGLGNISGSFTFDLFDVDAIAALEGVDAADIVLTSARVESKITLTGGEFAIDNDGENPASGTATISAVGIFESTVGPLDVTLTPEAEASNAFNLAGQDDDNGTATDPQFDGVGTQGSSTDDFAEFSTDGEMASDDSLFENVFASAFIGTGTFDQTYDITTSFDFGALGGIAFEGESIGTEIFSKVTYTYDVIPTPGTAALLGLGGLAVARRRR